MASQDYRKMAFWEVGKGRLAQDAQIEFERMVRDCLEKMVGGVMTIKLKVAPPNPREPDFGEISYSVGVTLGAVASQNFTTLLKDGNIVADGSDAADALQIDLELPVTPPRIRIAQGQ
jgi:hypothetical protein